MKHVGVVAISGQDDDFSVGRAIAASGMQPVDDARYAGGFDPMLQVADFSGGPGFACPTSLAAIHGSALCSGWVSTNQAPAVVGSGASADVSSVPP